MSDNENMQGVNPNQQYGGPQFDPNQQYGQQAYDQSQQYAQQAADQAQQYGQQAYDAGQQYAQQAADQTQQYGQQAYDQGQQYAQQTADQGQQYGQQAYDQGQQYSQQAYDQGQQYSQQAYDAGQQYAQQAADAGQKAADTVQQYGQESAAPKSSGMQFNNQSSSGMQSSGMKYDEPQYNQPQNYGQPAFNTTTPTAPETPAGGSSGGGPKKPLNKGIIIGAIAGVAVIAAVLLIFVFDVFGLRGGKPEDAAEKFVKAYSELDAKGMVETMVPEAQKYISEMGLGGSVEDIQSSFDMLKGFGVTFTDTKIGTAEKMDLDEAKAYLKDNFSIDIEAKDAAKVKCSMNMHMEFMGESADEPMEFILTVVKQGSKWYVAGFEEVGGGDEFPLDGDDGTTQATTEDIAQNTEDNTEDNTEASTEDAGNTEASTEAAPVFSGDGLDATLWLWGFDQNTWTYKEDKYTDKEKQSTLTIRIPKEDDAEKDKVSILVDAKITDPYLFREDLYKFGIDYHDYVDGKVPTVKVGGVDFIKNENGTEYIARLEGAKETINIKVRGDFEDAAVQPALDSLAFKVTDIGNVDGPWYWEGTPFDTEDLSGTVGSYTVNAKFFKMSDPLITHDVFNHRIVYADSSIYLMNEESVIRKYSIGETGIELAAEYPLTDKYKNIVATEDGRIFLSGNAKSLVEWKDGEIVKEYSGTGKNVIMAPDGTWGLSDCYMGDKVNKITISGDSYETTPMQLAEVGSIAHLNISNDHIFACGSSADKEEKGHKVFVYDTDGNLQVTLQGDDDLTLGSITFVFDTDNGYMAMDGNMRKIVYWDKDGNRIGYLEDSDLFGTDYPWFADSYITADGTMYTVMTEERDDKSAKEVLVYMMSGF